MRLMLDVARMAIVAGSATLVLLTACGYLWCMSQFVYLLVKAIRGDR